MTNKEQKINSELFGDLSNLFFHIFNKNKQFDEKMLSNKYICFVIVRECIKNSIKLNEEQLNFINSLNTDSKQLVIKEFNNLEEFNNLLDNNKKLSL